MHVHLAESGGLWKCYMDHRKRGKSDMHVHLVPGSYKFKFTVDPTNEQVDPFVRENFMDSSGQINLFKGTKLLQSFYYCDSFTEEVIIPSAGRFMLDSGAFTFFKSGKHVDWNDYVEKYADFINRNKVDLFFELDIDPIIGYENVKKLRRKLESLTGKQCIPVWHKSRGKDDFIQMCKDYDYVAIGGIITKEIARTEWKYFPYFINKAHENGAKIHGLGFTSLNDLTKYHFDSVDSTSWTSGTRFGQMYRFNGSSLDKFTVPDGMRVANPREAAIHNFLEWIKFQKYAEKHL